MIKKKNRFWTFCFSFIPGAGEMYMGFMKMGVSLMALTAGVFLLTYFLDMPVLLTLDAIVWFYGFFHVHNLRAMDDDVFYALEDRYLFHVPKLNGISDDWSPKYRKVIGAGLVLWGAAILLRNIWYMFEEWMPALIRSIFSTLTYRLPQLALAVVVIWIGILMIKGKKQDLYGEDQEPYKEEPKTSDMEQED